jgi:two-component system chemotaxis response regulator CheY
MNAKKVLVVDDSHMIRNSLSKILKQSGLDISEAANGEEALRILGVERIDLVICDLNMPVKSGMELLAESVTLRKNKEIPIVMLTTEGRPEFVDQARDLGANGWIVKPFNEDQIKQITRRFLGDS